MLNFKSLLFKEKYYSISYKLNFISKSNLFKVNKSKCRIGIVRYYNKFIFDKHKIKSNQIRKYYSYNKLHRDNKPAVIVFNNNKIVHEEYYQHGIKYRDNLPAVIEYDQDGNVNYEAYYKDGEQYRCLINGIEF